MSRTYRRRGERHEYSWVLLECELDAGHLKRVPLDRNSSAGRRAIARFHSDAQVTIKGGVPRWFCRIFKRRQRNAGTREMLRWLADTRYEPMVSAKHRNGAKWVWW